MTNERADEVLQYILRQVERDEGELLKLEPRVGWPERVRASAETYVPRVVASAADLMHRVELSLNSPAVVREIWGRVKEVIGDGELAAAMDSALDNPRHGCATRRWNS